MSHVLVIEDDEGVRGAIALLLESSHTVTCVEDCAGAEEAVVKAPPDVAILDVGLPRNASATAKSSLALAASLTASGIPLIFMTAYPDLAESLEGLRVPLLRKPFRLAQLRREIGVALGQTKQNQQRITAGLQSLFRRRDDLATMVARLGGTIEALETDLMGAGKDEFKDLRERASRARRLALLTDPRGSGPFYAIACQIESRVLQLEAQRLIVTGREKAHYARQLLAEIDTLFAQARAKVAVASTASRSRRGYPASNVRDLREEALVLGEEARAIEDRPEKREFASRAFKFAQLAEHASRRKT